MTWPVGKNGGVGIEVGDGGCGGVCGAGRNAVVVGVGAKWGQGQAACSGERYGGYVWDKCGSN